MFARDRRGFEGALPSGERIPPRLVNECCEYQCDRERERVRELTRMRDGLVDGAHGCLGATAEHGGARLEAQRAHARVVAAVACGKRGVTLRV